MVWQNPRKTPHFGKTKFKGVKMMWAQWRIEVHCIADGVARLEKLEHDYSPYQTDQRHKKADPAELQRINEEVQKLLGEAPNLKKDLGPENGIQRTGPQNKVFRKRIKSFLLFPSV